MNTPTMSPPHALQAGMARDDAGVYFLDSGEPEYIEPQESIEMTDINHINQRK